MAKILKGVVSQKKNRYKEDGFDLDLTYITPKIIAMGFPSVGSESLYRNPRSEVVKLFKEKHPKHVKVFNVCAEEERWYDADVWGAESGVFGEYDGITCAFMDHHAPESIKLVRFCEEAKSYLQAHEDNVIAVHCKAGKGRTGCVLACLLLRMGVTSTPEESLQYFADKRTQNGKGVTVPSQLRYVHYYATWLRQAKAHPKGEWPKTDTKVKINSITLLGVPNFDVGGGCDPFIIIKQVGSNELLLETEHIAYKKWQKDKQVTINTDDVILSGDVLIELYDYDRTTKNDHMCHLHLNTGSLYEDHVKTNTPLKLHRDEIDVAHKDNKSSFPDDFYLEISVSGAQ